MSIAVITGSAGLIGSEAVRYFARQGLDAVGIDNDMRRRFFGDEASTLPQRERLAAELGDSYRHASVDIRDDHAINMNPVTPTGMYHIRIGIKNQADESYWPVNGAATSDGRAVLTDVRIENVGRP